jgi:hypothetical protein
VQELSEAASSPCPHCGRDTKTVQGVCSDCWGVKDPDVAIDLTPRPKTEPLLGLGGDLEDLFGVAPWVVISGVALLRVVVVAVVYGLF